ncbi:MAG: quinone-dependent dihydroorotate dehydrogenase [Alkalinema sp. RU_4_3]|nr:quinone-dependent dihydroorotate dehydrogenase [Alkalinema sp. RU_4_3]
MDFYQSAIRPLLFSGLKADPEWLHQQTLTSLEWLDSKAPAWVRSSTCSTLQQQYLLRDDRLVQTLWGLRFNNPLGLAAGFDKNGLAAGLWSSFGFGFAEMGTVTLHGQPGNPQPRLFRLMEDYAALNRMGFNNDGAEALADRLRSRVSSGWGLPLGINLGKSKVTPLEEAAADYGGSFRLLKNCGDYFVVNVSSPNTPGLRSLQSTEQLAPIFEVLNNENTEGKPILVKIAPDLADEDVAAVVDLALQYKLAGIIATNTTIRRDGLKTERLSNGGLVTEEAGGISGRPVRSRSTEVIKLIYRQTGGKLPIVGVGGIFTAEDAWEKITAGASLLQVYTGWIYQGPGMAKQVMRGLIEKLDAQGLKHISEAVGISHE